MGDVYSERAGIAADLALTDAWVLPNLDIVGVATLYSDVYFE